MGVDGMSTGEGVYRISHLAQVTPKNNLKNKKELSHGKKQRTNRNESRGGYRPL